MRVILFTGKGGVGKTSVAAATAVRCAAAGYRTVVMSTDPAHSLGDSFDLELAVNGTKIATNLWAHEVSSLHEMQRHWAKLHEYAVEVFSTQGLDEVLADEVANPPGMDEVASLMWIKHYAQRDEHDVLIVDCAPTGETLQLLTFPDAAKWWLDKIYPWSRRAMRVARPVLQPMMHLPLPSDEVYASLKDLLLDLDGMRKVLTDPEITTVRIVLNLEKMVVKEAKRAYTYLSLFGYVTDAVIVNRILPGDLHDELLQKWQRIHQRYQAEVEQSFAGIPIFNVPLFDREVVGEKMLSRMAQAVYGDEDPSQRFATSNPQRIEKDGNDYVLTLKVPFVDKSAIDLSRRDGELYVTVGNYRREITLPRVLARRETSGAAIEEGELRVRFVRPHTDS
ncbi:MAG TPA: ArsA family ATPase [Candidatus Dormibacteraeota bacterium]|nr:ArsA family ATPase [Candidatus Dormibacteraeota bacterium]